MRCLTFFLLVVVAAVGCRTSSDNVKPSANQAIGKPSPGKARIVFIRPSSYLNLSVPTIIDQSARFVGDIPHTSKFAVDLAPGDHTFIVLGAKKRAMKARVAAGKTYYVEVRSGQGGRFAGNYTLKPIKPSSDMWPNLRQWLDKTATLDVDASAGQAELESEGDEAKEALEEGLERWSELDADTRAERTIKVEDGV